MGLDRWRRSGHRGDAERDESDLADRGPWPAGTCAEATAGVSGRSRAGSRISSAVPLAKFRCSVALPIVTDTGKILASIDNRDWSLSPHLPHQSENHELGPDASETAFLIGAAIAHLGRALADYPYVVDSFVDDPGKVLAEALPQLPDEVTRLVQPYAERIAEASRDLPVQLTHGDYLASRLRRHLVSIEWLATQFDQLTKLAA